ncbi:50S ribosomal protein L28 [Buchnera aphidicola (Eriosoma grossulariae)]|uniref:50S ribosomal protein L28 n=1 Tax=Buchnera aphidicola TaxID=9 RepID=UPI003464DA1D
MAKICDITFKKPMVGNHRSHAMNATKRRFFLNLHNHKFWIPEEKKFIKLNISAKGMRIIDKNGIQETLKKSFIKNKKNKLL